MTALHTLTGGAAVLPGGEARFRVWAPRASRVAVRVRRGGRADTRRLEPVGDGAFEAVAHAPPGSDYCYVLDDARERPDPVSRHQPAGVHGPSRVVDPHAFPWTDDGWAGVALEDLVIYEAHVGTLTPEGTFDAAAQRLAYLRDLGVTALELMPVAQFPGERNWGYDGVHPYAPQSSYGGPDGLRRLVDAAHAAGLAVFLDVVYNHFGPEGNYLDEYGPYFTDRYRTPWGKAVNFDDAGSDHVRRYVIDNAVYWITEFHLDGLRLDAVHAIFDQSPRHILGELADAVHRQGLALGRTVHVIAESDLNDPRIVRPTSAGGYALDAQWNEDFHHAVHAALTGERSGYYADFGGAEPVARALRDRFYLNGRHSPFRGRRHGAPADDVPAKRFIAFVQNHDQVGNRAAGERLGALVSFERQKLAAAFLLLAPYPPLLFMGEEYGETNPFLYFVSHGDPDLIEAVRAGRRREFAALGWRGDIPDPQAEETFARSRLSWSAPDHGRRGFVRRLYRDLLATRRTVAALRPGERGPEVRWQGDDWVTVVHRANGAPAAVAGFNLVDEARTVPLPDAAWHLRLATDDPAYGGRGAGTARVASDVTLAASSAALYEEVP